MGLISFVKDAGEKLWDNINNNKDGQNDDQSRERVEKLKSYLAGSGLSGADKVDVSVQDDTVKLTGAALNQEMKEKMMLILGNVAGVSKVEDEVEIEQSLSAPEHQEQQPVVDTHAPTQTESRFYTVQKGDTLSAIAKSEYGNANDYMKIFEANKPMLTHPDKIYPGQVLRIPQ